MISSKHGENYGNYFQTADHDNLISDILNEKCYILSEALSSRLERVYKTNGVPYSFFIARSENPPILGNRWFPKGDAWRVLAIRGDLELIEVGLTENDFNHTSRTKEFNHNPNPSKYWPFSTKEGGIQKEGGILRVHGAPDINEHLLRVNLDLEVNLGKLLELMDLKEHLSDSTNKIRALREALDLTKRRYLRIYEPPKILIHNLISRNYRLNFQIDISPKRVAEETFSSDLRTLLEKGHNIANQLGEDKIFVELYRAAQKRVKRRDLHLALLQDKFIQPELIELIQMGDGETKKLKTAITKIRNLLNDDQQLFTQSEGQNELEAFVNSVKNNPYYQALLRAI